MVSSDSEDENVIRYGIPLDPIEEDDIPSKRKYQEQTDQYAVDADGRRRFHGAFTGGFSAGYGNTVGTPEGWTPSTFKSSRQQKAQVSNQKPEDFMDEEDRSEYGIAPRQLQTRQEFSGRKRPSQKRFHDGPIPGEPVLEQIVRAVHESAAVRMVQAMGWREGQGAGERLTRREKRRTKQEHKVYGCYVPPELRHVSQPESEDNSTDSEFEYDTLFAPDDYEPYILNRKDNRFGLGYSGLSRHSVLGNLMGEYGAEAGTSRSHLVMNEKGRKVSIRGQAFGVGAFEAEDDDVYATENMSHYDFTLGGEEPGKKKNVEKNANVLEGFVKATKPLPTVPSYPPPALPRDYTPAPAGSKRSRFEPSSQPQRDQGLGRHELTAEARGNLLGETSLPNTTPVQHTPSKPIKIIDLTTPVSSQIQTEKTEDFISIKDSGNEVPKVFKPFASNPDKQLRYERFLRDKDSVLLEEDNSIDRLSAWERNREAMEFEQAAKLYKPLTGVMNDRFTHASEPDDALNPLSAVAKSSTNYGLATPEQIEAAKIGAYGVLTRTVAPWRPEALVCKRFNVPEIGGNRPETVKEDKPKLSYSIFSYLESSVHDKESFTKEQSKFSGSKSLSKDTLTEKPATINVSKIVNDKSDEMEAKSTGPAKRLTVAELFLRESEKDLKNKEQGVEVTETIEKFDKMDLYKSIFLSDSEPEEDSVKQSNSASYDDFIDKPKNIEKNNSPPRGIFANIDFDEINSWRRKADDKPIDTNSNVDKVASVSCTSKVDTGNYMEKTQAIDESDLYGPKIPDNLLKRLQSATETNFKPTFRSKEERDKESSSSSDSWVEAKEVKSKKSRKEKKKHKKHKSKHKKSKSKKKDR